MFYKLINENEIQIAPKPLYIDGKNVFTNSEVIHNEQGYYKLVPTKYPQDNKKYKRIYILEDNTIIEQWVEIPDTRTFEERVVSRIREVYSVDDELAILRQRDSKPEEFAEYNAFVENIKAEERDNT